MSGYVFNGYSPEVHESSFVHPTASIIGQVYIEEGCYIGPGASLRGDFGEIRVGKGSNIQDNCILHSDAQQPCVLAAYSHVGHGAIIHGATLHENTLVGMNSVILDCSVIETGAIIGANSLVIKGMRIPAKMLAFGSPARVIRALSDEEQKEKKQATERYIRLAQQCLYGMSR